MTRLMLETFWRETASRASIEPKEADTLFQDLCRRCTEPGRAYHTLEHVAAMLETVSSFENELHDPIAVPLAVWFHDAVYDAKRGDNEEQSVAYAMAALKQGGALPALLPTLERLILATKTHHAAAGDTDCQILLDADLAVLGSSPEDYERYAQAIRQEYAWVSESDYRTGRKKVLESFLQRERLYQTQRLFDQLEQIARENLRREIEMLGEV
jgi:predicted metal-dependent HD superfamily phosphohydrolase